MRDGAAAAVLAPVAALGVVLAGCPACHRVIGLDGAPGLHAALAAHQRGCPNRRRPLGVVPPADAVCPGCGCEAELYRRTSGWRCGDCLAEALA
jgi:putative hemolysin